MSIFILLDKIKKSNIGDDTWKSLVTHYTVATLTPQERYIFDLTGSLHILKQFMNCYDHQSYQCDIYLHEHHTNMYITVI